MVKHGHIGFHPQRQPGLFYVGVLLPVGRMTVRADARPGRHRRPPRQRDDPPDGLAKPADLRHSRGPHPGRQAGDRGAGLRTGRRPTSAAAWWPARATPAASSPPPTPSATPWRSPTTWSRASSWISRSTSIVTGCPNSCAQHYMGDIGLLAHEGGGRRGHGRGLSRLHRRRLRRGAGTSAARLFAACVGRRTSPTVIERMLRGYLAHRLGPDETFNDFVKRASHRPAQGTGSAQAVALTAEGVTSMAIPVLPESAPFTPAQRSWLNGFFAGLFGLDRGAANGHAANGSARAAQWRCTTVRRPAAPAPPPEAEEEFPWHDPALPMDERLKLAEGKPFEREADGRHGPARLRLPAATCARPTPRPSPAARTADLTRCAPGRQGDGQEAQGAGRGPQGAPVVEAATGPTARPPRSRTVGHGTGGPGRRRPLRPEPRRLPTARTRSRPRSSSAVRSTRPARKRHPPRRHRPQGQRPGLQGGRRPRRLPGELPRTGRDDPRGLGARGDELVTTPATGGSFIPTTPCSRTTPSPRSATCSPPCWRHAATDPSEAGR